MAATSTSGDEALTAINITPMVDIMLVLLVIFMVTTSAARQAEGIDVNRPDAATGEAIAADSRPVVVVCADQGVVIDGESMTLEAARTLIGGRVAEQPDLRALVDCDEGRPIAALVGVLDLLRTAGVHHYAIATEAPAAADGTRG
ncbi:MAG: biopolymer transporter ExbD [Deltaproteobacteria bacterium]|nr:biopolymer transporter ExbD [Nannocystaceae bacterium]